MKKLLKSLLSVVLVVSLLLTTYAPVYAVADEEYLSDLRIIYAEDYDEALDILADSDFADYILLDENLNEDTDEIGVWLAYKTTTDINDAITDMAVMQMDGGYNEGNYQEMIKQSYEEYEKISKKVKTAIEYFNMAYDDGYALAEIAYRQLNLYTIKTDKSLDQKYISKYEGELLGDVFYNGVDEKELTTMFMEGNTRVLSNIRSLLALGISYNEDGLTYMEKIAEAAAAMNDDPEVYADEDYDDLAKLMVLTLGTIKGMFEELSAYEEDLNFNDEEVTEEELKYAEHKTLANMMRAVEYLDGKTLYDFVLNFTEDKSDYSNLYPLVAALNEGQVALVNLICFYDVIRYSMSDFPVDYLDGKVADLEEQYGDNPFNLYEGVDRSVFKGTFALTTAAYRNDAYNDEYTLADAYFGSNYNVWKSTLAITAGATGIGIMIWGAFEKSAENGATEAARESLMNDAQTLCEDTLDDALNAAAAKANSTTAFAGSTPKSLMEGLMQKYFPDSGYADMTFSQQYDYFNTHMETTDTGTGFNFGAGKEGWQSSKAFNEVQTSVDNATQGWENSQSVGNQIQGTAASTGGLAFSTVLFLVGGAMLLASAASLIYTYVSYYNPDYDDIPMEIVDLVDTQYGDRYIKYDVVRNAEEDEDLEIYPAADLNAFEAQRWNALYFTKSYEAGKPLLADEFVVSNSNNKARNGYTPVHGFGQTVCYDLNKYAFEDDTAIYLSVKQSKNAKYAEEGVPEVVGSIFSEGVYLLFGGLGLVVGIGGTLGTQAIAKKKKKQTEEA